MLYQILLWGFFLSTSISITTAAILSTSSKPVAYVPSQATRTSPPRLMIQEGLAHRAKRAVYTPSGNSTYVSGSLTSNTTTPGQSATTTDASPVSAPANTTSSSSYSPSGTPAPDALPAVPTAKGIIQITPINTADGWPKVPVYLSNRYLMETTTDINQATQFLPLTTSLTTTTPFNIFMLNPANSVFSYLGAEDNSQPTGPPYHVFLLPSQASPAGTNGQASAVDGFTASSQIWTISGTTLTAHWTTATGAYGGPVTFFTWLSPIPQTAFIKTSDWANYIAYYGGDELTGGTPVTLKFVAQ